jgi:hypothetical protein
MPITVALYTNAGLGRQGVPITGATFEEVTSYDRFTPIYSPMTLVAGGVGPLSNTFILVSRFGTSTQVRCTALRPVRGVVEFRIGSNQTSAIVV